MFDSSAFTADGCVFLNPKKSVYTRYPHLKQGREVGVGRGGGREKQDRQGESDWWYAGVKCNGPW